MKRNSFLLYTDSMDIISELSDAQAGRLQGNGIISETP